MVTRHSKPARYKKKKPLTNGGGASYRRGAVGGNGGAGNGGGVGGNGGNGVVGMAVGDNGGKIIGVGNNGGGAARQPADIPYFPPEKNSLWPAAFLAQAAAPYRLIARNWREELPHLFAVFFIVLLLYGFTSPHKVTLEDDGLFIANMKFFGVAHPPGYPVHTFLGGLFYHLLPFGTPAFKGHFFSGFAGAIACAGVYACVVMLVRGRVFGYLAGLSYGAGRTFWSQAIIAEVYTLNAMFFFIVLALCIRYASHAGRTTKSHTRLLFIIAFVYGVAAANHYPILGLGTTGLVLMVLSQFKHIISPQNLIKAGVLALAGLAPPYAWMVWRSYDLTPANFYGPIETMDQFWFYFLRSGYSGVDKQEGVGLDDKIAFAKSLGDDFLWQFTPVGFFFAAVGLIVLLRSRYSWLGFSLMVSWFTSSVALVYLLDFKATFIWLAAFRVYHLLAFGIMAIWLGVGGAWFVDKLRFLPVVGRQSVGVLLVVVVFGGSVAAHWHVNNRSDYRWAEDLAMAKINSVEPNAVLFTFDDLDLPVGYLHFVEGVRPDLKVYNDQGLVYGDRLFSPLTPDRAPPNNPGAQNKTSILTQFIAGDGRPIYYHPARRDLYQHPQYGSDFLGFLRRVNRTGPSDRVILSLLLRDWLSDNIGIGESISDLWTQQQHYSTVSQLINTILIASQHGFQLDDTWLEVIERARQHNTLARMVIVSHWLGNPDTPPEKLQAELDWADNYDPDSERLVSAKIKSQFFSLRSNLVAHFRGAEDAQYEGDLRLGVESYDGQDNASLPPLLNYYLRNEEFCSYINLVDRFYPDVATIPAHILRNLRKARQSGSNCPTVEAA